MVVSFGQQYVGGGGGGGVIIAVIKAKNLGGKVGIGTPRGQKKAFSGRGL